MNDSEEQTKNDNVFMLTITEQRLIGLKVSLNSIYGSNNILFNNTNFDKLWMQYSECLHQRNVLKNSLIN
jgi:hypothetical protein